MLRGVHVAHLAVTTEGSREVEARAMETEGRVLGAFVDVLAVVAVPRKTGVTHTPWFRCWFCDLQDIIIVHDNLKPPSMLMHWAS